MQKGENDGLVGWEWRGAPTCDLSGMEILVVSATRANKAKNPEN
jgi:hypothetical protein